MQMKATRRYYHTPIRMVKREKLTISSAGQDVKQLEPSGVAGWHAEWHSHPGKHFGIFYKFKLSSPYGQKFHS